MVEVRSLLHLVLTTRSSLKMNCPCFLNVDIKAQHMFQRSCTVFDDMSNNEKYSIGYSSFKKQTGLKLYHSSSSISLWTNFQCSHF